MAIDINKLKEARKTIKETEEELMRIVKQHFEKNRNMDIKLDRSRLDPNAKVYDNVEKEIWENLKYGVRQSINVDGLTIVVEFSSTAVWSEGRKGGRMKRCLEWDYYYINCTQLSIYYLKPNTTSSLVIQGKQNVRFLFEGKDGSEQEVLYEGCFIKCDD